MLEVNKDNFESEVLKAEGLVLVDFWGEGCEPCKALMPEFESLANDYTDQVTFAKLNTSQERKLAISQRVLGLPTIVLYKNGERIGECTKEQANRSGMIALIEKGL